ncbi:related to 5-carboxyvanillate decarboxylase [Moesziomyces antarcticus]|uniref:Related to 5-carboxyvanillate decarboxylase n=2 Tax=Pseudozyma antarctica TaxID=84753 RepID=A0A5C3FK13_PSEA2|nr:related to 5-carboxyvanillate decarboxylase [Moesziomyces antarcticus]
MSLIALEEAFNIPSLAEQSAYQARLFVADGNGQAHADRLVDIHGERLAKMDKHGVAHTILSLTAPGIQDFDEPKAAAAAAREVNDWVHQQVQKNPKRFSAFASLSMHNSKDASDELRRCVKELGFVGALVNDNQRLPNDEAAWYDLPEWDDFWSTVTELDVPFYLHPIAPKGEIHRRIYKDRAALIGPVLSFANNVSAHLLGMIVNGVFDRHPKLKIIVGHLGEHIPFDLWRINHWLEDVHKPRGAVSMKKTIRDYFNENIWVTTSGHFSTLTLKYVQDEIGVDRILFSIDYPYEKFEDACDWFKTLDGKFSAEDLAKISHKNSQKLFPHLRS